MQTNTGWSRHFKDLPVWGISISPDWVLVPNSNLVMVLKFETGECITSLRGHSAYVLATAQIDAVFASSDNEGVVICWDAVTGVGLCKYSHSRPVYGLVFSWDGKCLISLTTDSLGFCNTDRKSVEKVSCQASCMFNTQSGVVVGLSNGELGSLDIASLKFESTKRTIGTPFALYADEKCIYVATWDRSAMSVFGSDDCELKNSIFLSFQPLCLAPVCKNLICIGGTSGQIVICSQLVILGIIATETAWITSIQSIGTSGNLVYGNSKGSVTQMKISLLERVYASHGSSVVWRDFSNFSRLLGVVEGQKIVPIEIDALIEACAVFDDLVAIASISEQYCIYRNGQLLSSFKCHNRPCVLLLASRNLFTLASSRLSVNTLNGEYICNLPSVVCASVVDGISGREAVVAGLADGRVILFWLFDNEIRTFLLLQETSIASWLGMNTSKSILCTRNNRCDLHVYSVQFNKEPVLIKKFSNITSASLIRGTSILVADVHGIITLWSLQHEISPLRQPFSGYILGSFESWAIVEKEGQVHHVSIRSYNSLY